MKKSVFIVVFFILFKPLSPIVEYIVNYEYISKVLCVNKETPIIGCNGKCYLMSQLAKQSEDEKPISDKRIVVKEVEVLFYQELKPIEIPKSEISVTSTLNTHYSNLYFYLNSCSTFHPPSSIS